MSDYSQSSDKGKAYIQYMTKSLIGYVTTHESCIDFMKKVNSGKITFDEMSNFVKQNVLCYCRNNIDQAIISNIVVYLMLHKLGKSI